jgi:hypothetical protein
MNFFHGCFSEEQIKTRYRDLCKQHHPDLGGCEETMKAVNLEYEERLRGEYRKDYSDDQAEDFVNLEKEVAAKVAEIIGLQGIIIELVGRWVWVTGETYKAKAALKAAGFWWASKKFAWYWHKPEDACRGGKKSLEEIKQKYGSSIVRNAGPSQLPA